MESKHATPNRQRHGANAKGREGALLLFHKVVVGHFRSLSDADDDGFRGLKQFPNLLHSKVLFVKESKEVVLHDLHSVLLGI